MDPVTSGVISGVIANGLTAVAAHIGHKGNEIFKRKDRFRQLLESDTALARILQKATASVARSAQFGDEHQVEKLRIFLVSPDVDAIVRQIYASQLSTEKSGYRESIRTEFLTSLSLRLGEPEQSLKDLAEHLFDALLKGCERALAIAIDKGILSAHEAKSAARHRLVLDELAAIKKNLALLTSPHKPNVQAILEFEEKYRQQVGGRHGHITPPHFDAARKLPIDDLYVPLDFVRPPRKRDEEPALLKTPDFLSVIYRAVLLGNPGGGKSTFTFKLCHDLATYYSERLFAGRQVTPILAVLREYGAEKKARNCSILQFIEITANSKYQVPPPPGAFEYLLLNGRAVVIFDGLDELLDTSYRREISGDVESFCSLYPSVPILVTSREVGYEQAPLDEGRFEVFRLAPFDEDQAQVYATKWFAADIDLTPEQQKQKAETFLEESRIVPDLRSNPLMLALMCNIYRGENYIPRNRPDVYEKCAVMLFERWDKSRGIHVPLPFEAHIRPAMMYLAHWIYADEALQGGVTERSLIAKATEYLCPRRFEDRDEAKKAASEFIEFCRGRAWVFTDTGTTREGERLYQFTHRTFLEYFTAGHLVRMHPTPDSLGAILQPKIAKREWDVVAQLAFQLQNKNVEGAGDELLSALLKQARETKGDRGWNLMSFAARCLEFVIPSPRVTRDITTACIERCLAWGLKRIKRRKFPEREFRYDRESKPAELLGDLLYAATENRPIVADCTEKLLTERINSGGEHEPLLALEIALRLPVPIHLKGRERVPQQEVLNFWESISNSIREASSNCIKVLCPKHFWLCVEAVWRRKVPITNLIEWYGVESLFRPSRYTILPIWWPPPALLLITVVLPDKYLPREPRYHENDLQQLEEVGRILLFSPPPWIRARQSGPVILPHWRFRELEDNLRIESSRELSSLGSDALFGAFALFAASLELGITEERDRHREQIEWIKKSQLPFFDSIRWIFVARFEQVETDKVQAEMDRCGFTAEQQAFAWRWARREIDLVQREAIKDEKGREDLPDEEEADKR